MTTTEGDMWGAAGVYTFPVSAMGMEVVSSNNTNDVGTLSLMVLQQEDLQPLL